MALTQQDIDTLSLQQTMWGDENPETLEAQGRGFWGTVWEIPKGAVKGVSQAAKGLVQLGAMPIDYLADTNLLTAIEDMWPKITTHTAVGDITSLLAQFGLPAAGAIKIANGLFKLKNASAFTKISSLKTIGEKTGELAKRAAFYGPVGGIADIAASTPGEIQTLGETLGIWEGDKSKGLQGSAKASEMFKEKLKFGAEGTVLGAVAPLLPVAGTLGWRYGLKPAGRAVGFVGRNTLRATNSLIVNPLTKIIGSELTAKGLRATKSTVGKQVDKLNLSSADSWKYYSTNTGPWKEKMLKRVDQFKDFFTSAGPLRPEIKEMQRTAQGMIETDKKLLGKLLQDIDGKLKDVANDFKVRIFDKDMGSETLLAKYKDDLFDYLSSPSKEAKQYLNKLPKEIKESASRLKALKIKLNKQFGYLLKDSSDKTLRELSTTLIKEADSYLKPVFSSFKNQRYKFDPEKVSGLKNYYKDNIIMKNKDLKNIVDEVSGFAKRGSEAWNKTADTFASNQLESLKKQLIESNRSPQMVMNHIMKSFKLPAIRTGKDLPTELRKIFMEKGSLLEPKRDYREAVVDTVLQATNQVHMKKFFDATAKEGVARGWLFKSIEDARARGILSTDLQPVIKDMNPASRAYTMVDSELFDGIYTTPEIANAIRGAEEYTTKLYNALPGYKSLMTVKSTAQIGKTVFSPMTQVRNVSTASFFALASGLIGGRVGLRDAWKILADDLVPGATVSVKKVMEQIDDMITRGVVDQNIEVQEIKNILQKAKDGKVSINTFMENPTVKKMFDFYQGGDNLWKIYADKFYIDALDGAKGGGALKKIGVDGLDDIKDWYKTIAKEDFIETSLKTGQKKTYDEAIKDVSAWLTTNTIPTYSKVPRIIREIRNLPLGNFIAFPAEILRTSSNLLAIGARELTSSNALIRQMGARRLLGSSAVFGGVGYTIKKTAGMLSGVKEEDIEAYQRSFAPDYQKNSDLVPIKQLGNGKFKFFDFSYSNPYNSLVRPVSAIMGAFGDGKLTNASADTIVMNSLFGDPITGRPGALTEFFAPFVEESIGSERIFDVVQRGGETRSGRKIFYPTDSIIEKIGAGLGHIIGGLEPGAFRSTRRIWDGATQRFSDQGTAFNTKNEITALMSGIRVEETKPLASMPFIISSYNKDKSNIQSKFSREAYSGRTSPEQKLAAYREYLIDNYVSQSNFNQTLKDAEAMGVDYIELQDILQGRFTKDDISRFDMGEFKSPRYSKERFKSLIDRLYVENPSQAIRLENEMDEAMLEMDFLKEDMDSIELGKSVDELRNLIDRLLTPFVRRERRMAVGGIATLPQQQAPNVQQQAPNAMQTFGQRFNLGVSKTGEPILPTGLTRTETALLRPSEQAMRLRERGLA